MARTHITPDGPKPCEAKVRDCQYGESNHFDSEEDAQAEIDRRGEQRTDYTQGIQKKAKRGMSSREKELVDKNKHLLKKIVNMRAEAGDVTYEDANPERALRRLNESIEYANSRNNTHLADQLSSARVLPSGAFKTADGKRINTDAVLKSYVAQKHLESQRDRVISQMNEVAKNVPVGTKIPLKTSAGSFNLTISEGVDNSEFEKLSAAQQKACSSERDSLSLDKAREKLSQDKIDKITNRSQVANYVVGKAPDVGQKEIQAPDKLKGDTDEAKLKDGLQNLSNVYEKTAERNGKSRELKAHVAEGSDAMKSVAAKHEGNTFAPARSQKNGALVTERQSVSKKDAEEHLSAAELKSITVKSSKPDPDKARLVLDDETYGRIFKARKASVRVTESKA